MTAVAPALAQDNAPSFMGNPDVPAPEFPADLDWLNVPHGLSFEEDLRGKIVVLDFWTYGCINCIHMIPILRQLEEKYADELVVIGVHSAKFANEGNTDNIRQIVQRYELRHPVINDSEFEVWNTYRPLGVNAWPTFVVIDPRGNYLGAQSGEVPFDAFDRLINAMVNEFDALGEINREPIDIQLEAAIVPDQVLAFPGKVVADEASNRLFIADSNHNRIIISDLDTYEVLDIIGEGTKGLRDGPFETAQFNKPQGMFVDGSTMYLADTENHVIRQIDLEAREVTTIAGTGEQVYSRFVVGPAREVGLNSPWDVELAELNGERVLFIAMAGPHQLWQLFLDEGIVSPIVGSGIEGLQDGGFGDAQLAQPSGLYFADNKLYFADSESSSLRVVDFDVREVRTVAGPVTNNLFDFGDVDGPVGTSRLQHVLGVTGGPNGEIFIADTYNSKIKMLDPLTNITTTLTGQGGTGGFLDGALDVAEFDEPGGLSYADGRLFIADTNNHAIRVIDLASNEVSTVTFPNPERLVVNDFAIIGGNSALGVEIMLDEQTLSPGESEILLEINLPEGFQLNDTAPFTATWSSNGEAITIAEENATQRIVHPEVPLHIPVSLSEGSDVLHGDLTIYYCRYGENGLCFIDELSVDAPVTVSADGAAAPISIVRDVPLPPIASGF